MNDLNIFETAKPQTGEFFKFKSIGDGLQGTYIDNREGVDSFGNDQIIYVLSDKTGKIWNLGFRKTSLVIHERMKNIRFGQIVGFRFDEERDSKRTPGTKVKIIRIYADPKLIDAEWLQDQKELLEKYGPPAVLPALPTLTIRTPDYPKANAPEEDLNAFPETTAPADVRTPSVNLPKDTAIKARNEAVEAIRSLAETKGLIAKGIQAEEADKAIEAYTKLPLSEENLTKIIITLTGYSKK